jgi:hypothetical protein
MFLNRFFLIPPHLVAPDRPPPAEQETCGRKFGFDDNEMRKLLRPRDKVFDPMIFSLGARVNNG